MRPIALFIVTSFLLFAGCSTFGDLNPDDGDDQPIDVVWTGQVRDSYRDIPLADQEVLLVETRLVGPLLSTKLVFGDTILSSRTDAEGRFSFEYTDPNEQCCWYSIHASRPGYLNRYEQARIHPTVATHQQDLILKPKAWLKIRVLDVPEQNVSQNGIVFTYLNVDEKTRQEEYPVLSIRPSKGDTTFYAFKPGGELTAFTYWDSDSMKTVSYQAIYPPFDTTALTFTY